MGLLGQKRADILKFVIFVQEISVICQKLQEINNLAKNSYRLTESLWEENSAQL